MIHWKEEENNDWDDTAIFIIYYINSGHRHNELLKTPVTAYWVTASELTVYIQSCLVLSCLRVRQRILVIEKTDCRRIYCIAARNLEQKKKYDSDFWIYFYFKITKFQDIFLDSMT